ncbi:MAG: NHLP leader peptide family RiPP precursor [Thermostichus sp. BF3_bins_97]
MSNTKSIEQVLVEKAMQDAAFKAELKANPKGALAQELGTELPANFEVQVLEATENKFYIVLPSDALAAAGADELSEEQLESVAGGVRVGGSACVLFSAIKGSGSATVCALFSTIRSRR